MKCVIIIPAWAPAEIFPARTAGSQLNYWQPLGVLYVAAALREAGHQVSFLDGAFLDHETIVRRVAEERPAFAGIYSTTFGWPAAVRTATAVKEIDAGIFTCAGGPYPSAAAETCLVDAAGALDAVVVGEGERTTVELLAGLASRKGLDGVAGVVFRRGAGIVDNPSRPPIEDLDTLPFPARDLLEDKDRYLPPPATYRKKPVAVMMTARGCDRHCVFCSQMDRQRAAGARGIRARSVENVIAEIEACLRDGYREIKFIDDSFAADRGRALAICREIRARRLNFPWFASACVNQVDAPLLLAMREAGCWAILLGAESGVQKNLNTLRKGITLDQTRRAVKAAKKAGLVVQTPFVLGIPGETAAEALKTIEFAVELGPDLANFHALTPFPGTDLYDRARDHGSLSERFSDYTYQGAAFVPHTMTREELIGLRQLALRRFYGRPSYILRRLAGIRALSDLRVIGRGAVSLFWLWADRRALHRRSPGSA